MNTETKQLAGNFLTITAKTNVELLCPAGDRQAFLAALQSGANAVYLGVDNFNARRNAQNFTLQDLPEVCDLAHLAGLRVYLTLNIAILPSEYKQAMELARQAWYLGIDALIVADLGLLDALHREQPQIELHASTQTNVQSTAAVRFLADLGANRVTLSRELSVAQVEDIAKTGTDLEVFAHGALCFSYSGQCLMSSLVGCRSANRGLCAQPCRLPYRIIDTSTGRAVSTPGDYLLSTADLSSLEILPELVDAGVKSLKIEGRMRKADYVAATAQTYRRVLDNLDNPDNLDNLNGRTDKPIDKTELYSQRGFTTGYLGGHRDNSIMDFRRHNTQATASEAPKIELENEGRLFSKNTGLIKINFTVDALIGQNLRIKAQTIDAANSSSLEGAIIETARSKPITKTEIMEHVGRVGSTPFSVENWQINLDDGVGIGFSALHKLRSLVLEQLSENILAPWHSRTLPTTSKHDALAAADRGKVRIAALVSDAGSAKAAIKAGAQKIYYHTLLFEAGRQQLQDHQLQNVAKQVDIAAFLPNIAHDNDLDNQDRYISADKRSLINNLGQLQIAISKEAEFEIGPSLPTYNLSSLELYTRLGAQRVWLGPELSLKNLEQIALNSPLPLSLTISGYQELMTSEHCVFMAEGPCDQRCDLCKRRKTLRLLEDRKGYKFPVRTDNTGRSHIYNAIALDLIGEIPKLMALGISEFVVDCTLLPNAQIEVEVGRAVRAKDLAVRGAGQLPKQEGRTTGHLFRGIL